ncbi:RDD family protein [Actinomadura alba]|uniref:RDD family protein n=1 Tax=Actinomadura alba TaxID=406431 RepID=A0ABR7LJ22_9ACTN|nr:RDD family protein [Actinomadura alba]MBC6464837.1 RDD family protein [Actinomadura alba]
MAELVTGEAVALDIRVARLASRAVALLLDLLFQASILNVVLYVTGMTAVVADEAWGIGLSIVAIVAVVIGYPTALETLTRGRTLGKMALGLRVVGEDGGPVRFRQALVRALAGFVEVWLLFGSPALIASLLNLRGKRLGDIFAGTIVIQDRVPASALLGPVAVMPPQLAGWGQSLELSRVSDALALTARQYLTRFWELMPEVRDAMGQRIAEQVVAVVSPPPPPGVRPEILLSAVLAERRRREEWRLHQRMVRRTALLQRSLGGIPFTAPGVPVAAGGAPGQPWATVGPLGPPSAPAVAGTGPRPPWTPQGTPQPPMFGTPVQGDPRFPSGPGGGAGPYNGPYNGPPPAMG